MRGDEKRFIFAELWDSVLVLVDFWYPDLNLNLFFMEIGSNCIQK